MSIPEFEVVAIRTDGPHEHIVGIKLVDGTEFDADDVVIAIQLHQAHYVAEGKLVQVQQCPDCLQWVLWS